MEIIGYIFLGIIVISFTFIIFYEPTKLKGSK